MAAKAPVSVFIRAKDEEEHLESVLTGIFSQDYSGSVEVVLLDSGSTDGTLDIAQKFAVEVYQIPGEVFTYSSALAFGVEVCSGDIFVPLSAHCVPVNDVWLRKLVEPLVDASGVVASYSRQVSWPEASSAEERSLAIDFSENSYTLTNLSIATVNNINKPIYDIVCFSNASSAIIRRVAQEVGFLEIPFCEDRAFALDCLRNKKAIRYVVDSVVYHSHYPSLKDFRNVARAATVSRFIIEERAAEFLSEDSLKRRKSDGVLCFLLKLVVVSLLACFSLLRFLPFLLFQRKARREVAFAFASIGTTLGKRMAWKEIESGLPSIVTANTERIQKEVRKL